MSQVSNRHFTLLYFSEIACCRQDAVTCDRTSIPRKDTAVVGASASCHEVTLAGVGRRTTRTNRRTLEACYSNVWLMRFVGVGALFSSTGQSFGGETLEPEPQPPVASARRFTAQVLPSIPEHRVLGRRVLVREVRKANDGAAAGTHVGGPASF